MRLIAVHFHPRIRSATAQRQMRRRFSFRRTAFRSPMGTTGQAAVSNAIGYAEYYSRSHGAVIRVCDLAGNVVETREHKGDFKAW